VIVLKHKVITRIAGVVLIAAVGMPFGFYSFDSCAGICCCKELSAPQTGAGLYQKCCCSEESGIVLQQLVSDRSTRCAITTSSANESRLFQPNETLKTLLPSYTPSALTVFFSLGPPVVAHSTTIALSPFTAIRMHLLI
jgi:hypothetical protein